MNGRVYDPTIGRFMSADPKIQDPNALQSFNRYAYVWNNPLNSTDPSGFEGVISENNYTTGQNLPVPTYSPDHDWNYTNGAYDRTGRTRVTTSTYVKPPPGITVTMANGWQYTTLSNGVIQKSYYTGFGNWFTNIFGYLRWNYTNGPSPLNIPVRDAKGNIVFTFVLGPGAIGEVGVASLGADAMFAQKTYSAMFSAEGTFAGQSVDDIAAALRAGVLNPAEVPVNYIVRDGQTIILNTRSAQALDAAGISRSEWTGLNRTGDSFFEGLLNGQLSRNPGGPFETVRRTGGQ